MCHCGGWMEFVYFHPTWGDVFRCRTCHRVPGLVDKPWVDDYAYRGPNRQEATDV